MHNQHAELTRRHRGGGEDDMHVYMKQQLAEDRVAELRADAQRARNQRVRRAQRASGADPSLAPRQWRVLVQALMAR